MTIVRALAPALDVDLIRKNRRSWNTYDTLSHSV
jgi:hypothetical protein